MSSFAAGLVGGLGSGMAFGRAIRDSMDEKAADEVAGFKLEEIDAPEPARDPEQSEQAVFEAAASADMGGTTPPAPASAEPPSAPTPKKSWAIGTGEQRKVWDTKPSDDEVRQWRYDTMLSRAGSKRADEWFARTATKDKLKRDAEKDTLELDQARLLHGDAKEIRALQTPAAGADGGPGLSPDPTSRYRTMLQSARILSRTNPEAGLKLEREANKQAAGQFISALQREDGGAVKALYNVFPNGHLVQSVRFKDDNAIIRDGNGERVVPIRELGRMAMAIADPEYVLRAADSEVEFKDRLAQKDAQLQWMRDKQQFGGGGSGSGSGGGSGGGKSAGGAATVSMDGFKKVADLFKTKTPDGGEAYGRTINGVYGEFNLPDAYRTALDIQQQQGGDADAAYDLASTYEATKSAHANLQAALKAAGSDTKQAEEITKQIDALPKIGFQLDNNFNLVETLQKPGLNAATHPIRAVNPSQDYDLAKNPNAAAAIIQAFRNNPQMGELAGKVLGDGTKPVSAEDQKARLKDVAEQAYQAGIAAGKGPDAAKFMHDRVLKMAEYLPVYDAALTTDRMAKADAERAKAAGAPKVRAAQDVEKFGPATMGLGGAIAAGAKYVGKKVSDFEGGVRKTFNDAEDLEDFTLLNAMVKERAISDDNLARFRELLGRHPEYAERFNLDPKVYAQAEQ